MRTAISLCCSFLLLLLIQTVTGSTPISNVQVTLRGKKYDIGNADGTVEELQQKIKDISGVDVMSQGRVLFDGKKLEPSDILSDVGVTDGSHLNLVPGSSSSSKSSSSKSSTKSKSSSKSKKSSSTISTKEDASSSTPTDNAGGSFIESMLKNSGIDKEQIDQMMKSMPKGPTPGGSDDDMMKESINMMSGMMNSPLFQDLMNDPEKLEEGRKMILSNPMLKGMMSGMPGMSDILENPELFRTAMQGAAQIYKEMDPDDLVKAMNSMKDGSDGPGASGMGAAGAGWGLPSGAGGAGGLFGDDGNTLGSADTTSNTALDELSEDDE